VRSPLLSLPALLLTVTLVPAVTASPSPAVAVATAAPESRTVLAAAPAGKPRYAATIKWTEHGIPHITAQDFGSLGFGSGYATSATAICTLADTLITGRGTRSRWFGPNKIYDDQVSMNGTNLQIDTLVGDLHNRRVVEKLLASDAGPGREARAMVTGYAAGANTWLRRNRVTDPACQGAGYLRPDVKPIDVWYGVYLANLLASTGVFVKEIVDADPASIDDPGLPIPLPIPGGLTAAQQDDLRSSLRPKADFGSNATAVGGAATTTGKGMLLGNPHFPWRGRYHFTQQHLTIPGKYDVAGASLVGSPVVNIGFNNDVAWSHTVSTAYRFTPYEYPLLGDPMTYLTESGPKRLERRVVKVRVKKPNGSIGTVTEDLYRTAQGYVSDSPSQFMGWTPTTVWALRDANAEQLRTIDTFLNMGKAHSVRDLLRRQDAGGGMPWVNTVAADRAGDVLYADHSVVPHVTNEMKQRCLTPVGIVLDQVAGLPGLNGALANTACAWGSDASAQRPGMFGPENLPDVVRRDWVMNANDSYWLPNPASPLEGFSTIIGCERCERTMRTRMVSQYVIDQLAGGGKESPRILAGHEYANRLRAAEVMRADGALDEVCAATGETEGCRVLKAWDGRSDTTSVGTHIFEFFLRKLPDNGVWTTPFSATDPLNTPRGLNADNPLVVRAMERAFTSLRNRKIPFDRPWGKLQVAGDRGAPPIPLGGGTGDSAGNANALASRNPVTNKGRFSAITYGSSHIQSIAFLSGDRVSARTILTYGQSENPRSPFSSDQTRLFSQEKWVDFAWTDRQIAEDLIRTERVTG